MNKQKITINNQRLVIQVAVIISLILICHEKPKAQIAFIAGGNYSNIRSNISLENKKPIIGYNLGLAFQYYPFKRLQNISIINEPQLIQKGYRQNFEEDYFFRFDYLSLPILINYSLSTHASIQAGIDLSKLISTNLVQGLKTYNDFDIGLVLGLNYFAGSRISCFSRLNYGLLPMLDYYEIDELGNFKNEIHDLKNITLTIGMKVNIYNEKIRFQK